MLESRITLALLISGLFLSGCATATLPQGPDIYSLAPRSNTGTILVAHVVDQRTDKQHLGNIGALGLSMKTDPSELVAKEVVAALYQEGINSTLGHASSDNPTAFPQTAQQANAQGILALAIQSISIKSFDALMDPPTAEIVLQATLYDNQGNAVESENITGHVQRKINTFAADRATGELVGEAAHDAAQRLVNHPTFSATLKKVATSK